MKIEELENLKLEVESEMKKMLGEKLRKVILYGSYARGDYDEESDIDFAVIAEIPIEKISSYDMQLGSISFGLSMKYDVLVSVLIICEENFNVYKTVLPFYGNLIKEGIPFYDI